MYLFQMVTESDVYYCPWSPSLCRIHIRTCLWYHVCTPSRQWLEVMYITKHVSFLSPEPRFGLKVWYCMCAPSRTLLEVMQINWMHALSLPRQSMVLCVCTPSRTWLEVTYITGRMPFLSPEPQPGVEGRCGPAGLSWLPDQQQEGPAPLGAGAAPGIPDLQWRLPHPPHLPTLEQHRGTGPLCCLLSVCLSACAAWEDEWLRHGGDRLISSSACTDETHHSFDCRLHMTARNHFYSENSHLL